MMNNRFKLATLTLSLCLSSAISHASLVHTYFADTEYTIMVGDDLSESDSVGPATTVSSSVDTFGFDVPGFAEAAAYGDETLNFNARALGSVNFAENEFLAEANIYQDFTFTNTGADGDFQLSLEILSGILAASCEAILLESAGSDAETISGIDGEFDLFDNNCGRVGYASSSVYAFLNIGGSTSNAWEASTTLNNAFDGSVTLTESATNTFAGTFNEALGMYSWDAFDLGAGDFDVFTLAAGESIDFTYRVFVSAEGSYTSSVDPFRVIGAFSSFADPVSFSGVNVTRVASETEISAPGTLAMFGISLLALGSIRRKTKA